jgi:hypothetical protein
VERRRVPLLAIYIALPLCQRQKLPPLPQNAKPMPCAMLVANAMSIIK